MDSAVVLCVLIAALVLFLGIRAILRDLDPPSGTDLPAATDRAPRPSVAGRSERTGVAPARQGPIVIEGPAYVVDGDSLVIRKTQIRLFGIDAPELNHPYGKNAKFAMIALCKGQTVRAEVTELDVYGRTVARCYLPDGRDLSAEMVKAGLAIDWPKFSGGTYRAMEVPGARKRMWLADARQKGRMHIWERFEAGQATRVQGR